MLRGDEDTNKSWHESGWSEGIQQQISEACDGELVRIGLAAARQSEGE